MQNLKLVRLGLYPVRQDLRTHELKVTTDLIVQVDFKQVKRDISPVHLPKSFYHLAKVATSNGATLDSRTLEMDANETMLIVTADDLKAAMKPFIDYKKSQGLNVIVATFSEAGKSKEKAKTYIQKFYDSQSVKPTYLLFVGNKDTMPAFMEDAGGQQAATDYTYGLLAGDDNVPDIFYGRFVADNESELAMEISRAIDYEKNADSREDWLSKGTTIASQDGSGPSDKEYAGQIEEILKAHSFSSVDEFYQGEQTATAANIVPAISEGRSWVSYFGHGTGTAWASTNDTFNVGTVATVTNVNKMPVIIDVACQNASWVKISKCFGKAWVTQQTDGKNSGAVAFYGGSVNISWHPPAIMSVGVAKTHFEKSVPSLGGATLGGQLYLIEQKGNNEDTIDNLKWYNLFGDPSLGIRTAKRD
jgi:hypothetical protein